MTTTISWSPRYAALIALAEDGETQKDLAARLGWEPSRLSRLLKGRIKGSFEDWMAVARAQGRDITFYVAPVIDLNGAKGVSLHSLLAPAA